MTNKQPIPKDQYEVRARNCTLNIDYRKEADGSIVVSWDDLSNIYDLKGEWLSRAFPEFVMIGLFLITLPASFGLGAHFKSVELGFVILLAGFLGAFALWLYQRSNARSLRLVTRPRSVRFERNGNLVIPTSTGWTKTDPPGIVCRWDEIVSFEFFDGRQPGATRIGWEKRFRPRTPPDDLMYVAAFLRDGSRVTVSESFWHVDDVRRIPVALTNALMEARRG